MRCNLYSKDGRLVSEGPCGLRRDGAIEMVAERANEPLKEGDGPLVLVEGPRRYEVRVDEVHGLRGGAADMPVEVYHLAPIEQEREHDTHGFLGQVRSRLGL